jgi:hypothetical protein
MDLFRIGAALAVSLGIPVLAMVQPGSPSTVLGSTLGRPVANGSSEIAKKDWKASESVADKPPSSAAAAFRAEITRLSDDADGVDRLWQSYKEQCGARAQGQGAFGREWFAIPEGKVAGSSDCTDLLNLIRQTGNGIKADLRRATSAGRRAQLDQGTEVGLLRWHSLELPN